MSWIGEVAANLFFFFCSMAEYSDLVLLWDPSGDLPSVTCIDDSSEGIWLIEAFSSIPSVSLINIHKRRTDYGRKPVSFPPC